MKKKWKAITMAALMTVSGTLGITQNAAAGYTVTHPDGTVEKLYAYDGIAQVPADLTSDGQWGYGLTGYDGMPVVCKYFGSESKAAVPHHINGKKVQYLTNPDWWTEDGGGGGFGPIIEPDSPTRELIIPCTVTRIYGMPFISEADCTSFDVVIPPSVESMDGMTFGGPFGAKNYRGTITCAPNSGAHKLALEYNLKYQLKDESFFHLWDSGRVTKEAGALTEGEKTYSCIACGKTRIETIPAKEPVVRLNASSIKVQRKKTTKALKISSKAAGDTVVSWTSSKPTTVSVNKTSGAIKGLKNGTAVITLKMKSGATASCKVTVQSGIVRTTKISGLEKKIPLSIGKKAALKPIISPITSQEKVTYSSSNKKIATVTKTGVITAKKSGTAKITVKSGKKKFTVTVSVPKIAPTEIKNVLPAKTLKKGKSYTLKPKLAPSGSEAKITYRSSDKKVAVVNSKGKITAKKKGSAVITVKAGTLSVTCTVKVK